jgi:hypothetical protein
MSKIADKQQNSGAMWIKRSTDNLPVAVTTLSSAFLKYSGTSFFEDITSNSINRVCAFGDSILIKTSNGVAIDKVDTNILPISESINLTTLDPTDYAQWWWSPVTREVFYVTLSQNLTMSWFCHDVDKNITKNLMVSSLSSYISGTLAVNGIDISFNETTRNFNVSFSFRTPEVTNYFVGIASVIFPYQTEASWQLNTNKIYQFSTPR